MISMLYTKDFQIRMLAALYVDPKLFADTNGWFHLSDFDLAPCRLIFEVCRNFWRKNNRLPTFDILSLEVLAAVGAPGKYETMIQLLEEEPLAQIMGIVHRTRWDPGSSAYFRAEINGYIKHMRLSQLDAMGITDAQSRMAETVRIHQEIERAGVSENDTLFMDALDRTEDPKMVGDRIGLGVHGIDRLINMGLTRKMLAMLVACTGVGKTCGLINIGVNAALQALRSLFITLELPGQRIADRFQGIMAGIDAAWFSKPETLWTPDVQWRLNYAASPEFKYRNNMTIADCSERAQSLADIDAVIARWKDRQLSRGFTDESCAVVFVDWLEKIDITGVKGVTKNTNDATALKKVLEHLGEIGRRHNVLIWTATQATRDAMGREVLDIKHTAHSIHVHDPLDLSIGIAPQQPPADNGNPAFIPNEDTYMSMGNEVQPPCDRGLNASFMKTRYSAVAGKYTNFYQGPTLRFWDRKEQARIAQEMADAGDMEHMFMAMAKPGGARK